MKRLVIALLAAVCLAVVPEVTLAKVPEGDHISHVAEDGSYRDNDRDVWVDACGKAHPLCPAVQECPPAEECPEIPEQVPCENVTQIALSCPMTSLTAAEIQAIAMATVAAFPEPDPLPRSLQGFSVQAVVGQNDFQGIQARKNWFGVRAGRIDMSEFPHVKKLGDDPLDKAILGATAAGGGMTAATWGGNDEDCDDDEGSDDPCVVICHKPSTPAEKTKCVPPSAVSGHMGHGDYRGECEGSDDPYCGNGNVDYGENCDNCPQDMAFGVCDDPEDPEDPEDLGWKRTDDEAETLEAFVYIDSFFKGKQRECFKADGKVKALCRLGLYVGGGAVRFEEERISNIDGELRSIDDRYKFKLTGTAGADYTFPCRLTVGIGYHTEAGALVHAGYGIIW